MEKGVIGGGRGGGDVGGRGGVVGGVGGWRAGGGGGGGWPSEECSAYSLSHMNLALSYRKLSMLSFTHATSCASIFGPRALGRKEVGETSLDHLFTFATLYLSSPVHPS